MTQPEKSGRGCGCACLGCLAVGVGLAVVFSLLLALAFWFWGGQVTAWVLRNGSGWLGKTLEEAVLARTRTPQPLPSLPQSPEAASEVVQRVQAQWQDPTAGDTRRLHLSEEEANLLLRGMLQSPERPAALAPIHDAYVRLAPGKLRLQGVLRGPALAAMLPEALPAGAAGAPVEMGALYQRFRGLVGRADYLNVDGTLAVLVVPGGGVALQPEALSVLGLPLPVSLLEDLVEMARARAGQSSAPGAAGAGVALPGVRRLVVGTAEMDLETTSGTLGPEAGVP